MIIVGVTGGIGSGKSTVCKIFELLGVPVYYADEQARLLTDNDPRIRHGIRELLGDDLFIGDKLDRKKVGEMVFNDKFLLKKLNGIIHPVVAEHFEQWLAQFQNIPMVVKEAAILFESGSYVNVDKVITVVAPVELRIKRLIKRDGLSVQHIRNRMDNQWDDSRKIALSGFVVYCDEKMLVIPQVLDIYKNLMNVPMNT